MVNFRTHNWKTRIELTIGELTDSGNIISRPPITPYNAIAVNFARPMTVIDSVDDSNIGYIFGNRRYTFFIEVFPVRSHGLSANSPLSPLFRLNDLFLNGKSFNIKLRPIQRDISTINENTANSTWIYKDLTLLNCVFTTGGVGSYDSTAGLKVIRFDGLSLGVQYDTNKIFR